MTGQMRPNEILHTQHSSHYMPEDERRIFQNPEAILSGIGLKPGDTFIEMGCGEGFFTLPAARIVKQNGVVYGIDTNLTAIDHLNNQAKQVGLSNIITRVAEAENTILCTACADIIFFGIVLHDFKNPEKVLKNALVMLKPEGKLVNFDWKKLHTSFGPPVKIRFSEEQAESLIEKAGFTLKNTVDYPPYNYLITAVLKTE
jgi:ubiquinone/menaquinone biosynthesis C-methylase UbiE